MCPRGRNHPPGLRGAARPGDPDSPVGGAAHRHHGGHGCRSPPFRGRRGRFRTSIGCRGVRRPQRALRLALPRGRIRPSRRPRARRQTPLHGPPHPPPGSRASSPRTRPCGGVLRHREPGTPSRLWGCPRHRSRPAGADRASAGAGGGDARGPGPAARPAAARTNAERGSRNAEQRRRCQCASDPSTQFRIPHAAFRILMAHTPFRVGRLTCHALEAGRQALDGGAMFGVVPKPLWQRRIPADERNRIPLALRCLLVEHDDGLVLVDTGLGNKEGEKFKDIYGVVNEGKDGRTQLEDALAELGHAPAEVRWVIDTHLHFDHAGGNTYRDPSGRVTLSFPKARYVVQQGELEFARHTNERTAASYLPPNFESVPFTLVEGETQPLPGIRCLPTPGHVPYHQSVLVESGGERVCFLADLVPTSAHLPLPWIMGYDLEPLVTLESKRRLYARAEAEGWLLFFEHDPAVVAGRLGRDGKAFALVDPLLAG